MSLKNTSKNTQLSSLNEHNDVLAEGSKNKGKDNQLIPWNNGFYKIWWNIRRLFTNPFAEKKQELRLLDLVNILVSTGDPKAVSKTCEDYISLHRVVENTKARARLEKWITRLIVGYLIIVGIILIWCSLHDYLNDKKWPCIQIESTVLVALLTTTTINIVALGIILVRGLFHEHEKKDINTEKPVTE